VSDQTIWKFELPWEDFPTVRMPRGARPLSCGIQEGKLCVWALIPDPAQTPVLQRFRLAGTGHPLTPVVTAYSPFIGTVQFADLVFHVFYLGTIAT
jgi:hypothetical protein